MDPGAKATTQLKPKWSGTNLEDQHREDVREAGRHDKKRCLVPGTGLTWVGSKKPLGEKRQSEP